MRAAVMAMALAIAAGPAAAQDDGGAFERSVVDLSPSAGEQFTKLVIDNSLGDVQVEGHDSNELVIVAVKRAPDRESLERLKVSLVPDPRGPVSVRTRMTAGVESRPVPAGTVRVDLRIRAPRSAQIRVRTWNGRVAVTGVDNGAELAANEGDIDVSRVLGAVSTTSAQGQHRLGDIIGEVTTRSLVGDVKFDLIRGRRLHAVVHKGTIVATRIESREIDLRVLRGDASVEINPAVVTSARIRALRGDVRVRAQRKPVRVEVASRGRVTWPKAIEPERQADGSWVAMTGPEPQARVSIRTGVGNVVFAVHGN